MTYEDLLREINKGRIQSAYLFVGKEESLKQDAILRIKKKEKARVVLFDEKKPLREIASGDIFGEKSLVVLKEPSIKERDFIAKYINHPSSSIILIIFLKKMVNWSLPKVSIVSFPKLYGGRLKAWIKERFKEKEKTITEEGIELLLETIGENIDFLMREIEKIALFSDKKALSQEDILPIISKRHTKDIFNLLDAIGERKMEALSICNMLLSYGEAPNYILFMIERRMREIFSLKEGISENIEPWQKNRILNYTRLFLKEEALPIFSALADCSLKLKSYKENAKPIILLSLIYHIIK